jgi:hypothetical protein
MNQKPQKVNTGLLPVGLLSVLWVTNEETSTEQISRYIEDAGNQVFFQSEGGKQLQEERRLD